MHEQNPWLYSRSAFVHHSCGWIAPRRRALPARARVPAALARRSRPASRSSVVAGRLALYTLARLAPVFGHLAPLAGAAAPMRRLAARCRRSSRSRSRRRRSRTRAAATSADVRPAARRVAARRRGPVRPGREGAPERDPRLRRDGDGSSRASRSGAGPATVDVTRLRRAAAGRVHGALERDLDRQPRRPGRLHVRRSAWRRRRRPRRTARPARRATEHIVRWPYFLCLALLIGGLGFRLLVAARAACRRRRAAVLQADRLGVVAVLEVGIVAFLLRAEDALQLPFAAFLYGDLSPFASETRFGTAFIAMTLGFALVAALLFLAWLIERRVLLWPAFALALGFASGLSLSGHSAAPARRGSRSSPTGCTSPRRRSGSAGWSSSRSSSGRAPDLRRRRSRASRGCAGADRAPPRRRRLPQRPSAPEARRPVDAATASVLLVKLCARLGRARVGRVAPLHRAAALERGPTCRDMLPRQPARRGDGRDGGPARSRPSSSTRSRRRSPCRRRRRR